MSKKYYENQKKKKIKKKGKIMYFTYVRFRSCNFKICQKNIMKIRKRKNISTKKKLQ